MFYRFKFLALGLAVAAITSCCSDNRQVHPSGTLETTETDISSVIASRILEVRSMLGQEVKAGDTLIVLDVEVMRLQRAQLEATAKGIEAQKRVAANGQTQAKSTLALAETTLTRTETLLTEGSVSQQQMDEIRTRRDVASAQVSAASNQLSVLEAEEDRLQASLAVLERQIADGVIRSPHEGTVILRSAEPGETATPGSVLLRVADLSRLELRIFVDNSDLARVKIGDEIRIVADAFEKETIKGRVTWISSEAEFTPKNVQTRNARAQLVYAVKIAVDNPDGRLNIGMPAEAVIP